MAFKIQTQAFTIAKPQQTQKAKQAPKAPSKQPPKPTHIINLKPKGVIYSTLPAISQIDPRLLWLSHFNTLTPPSLAPIISPSLNSNLPPSFALLLQHALSNQNP